MARSKTEVVIEPGGRGVTYRQSEGFTAYELGVYPRGSVLAGQQSRRWLDHYATLEEALAAHPGATVIEGTSYQEVNLSHLPDDTDY